MKSASLAAAQAEMRERLGVAERKPAHRPTLAPFKCLCNSNLWRRGDIFFCRSCDAQFTVEEIQRRRTKL